ncbi:hypothetical protein CAK95_01445 [Pseudorhodoplanes sinuspersici]|uniref:Uncharacterized protein n=1 Tax=Pseudorhodoplanes sinuspersici TaxID=1235591 RepID=A0A1W6ZKN8_9HYPH|nr:hypothetical protein CAK95_01445 [Pseudorhodoplanes sinuspersici]
MSVGSEGDMVVVQLCLVSDTDITSWRIVRMKVAQLDCQACQECQVKTAAVPLARFWAAAQPQGAVT